jgi:hypothetical protein
VRHIHWESFHSDSSLNRYAGKRLEGSLVGMAAIGE